MKRCLKTMVIIAVIIEALALWPWKAGSQRVWKLAVVVEKLENLSRQRDQSVRGHVCPVRFGNFDSDTEEPMKLRDQDSE